MNQNQLKNERIIESNVSHFDHCSFNIHIENDKKLKAVEKLLKKVSK